MQRETAARKKQSEEVANATIKAAAARDDAEHQVYVNAQKENQQFNQRRIAEEKMYQQAIVENREFDQARHRGFYSIQDPEEIRQNDIRQQDILSRMPSLRQARAFYAEQAAEREAGPVAD
jgi:CRISPR/Cas system CSM-associated protein Csm2 small subunit